jgi:hypothetical protein
LLIRPLFENNRALKWALCVLTLLISCAGAPPGTETPAPPPGASEAGEALLGFRLLFPTRIEASGAALVFQPALNRAYLEFPYQTVTYRQYWDRPARELFIAAVNLYQADLDTGGPPRQSAAKARRAYGRFNTRTEWGIFPSMLNYAAYPQVDLGYTLIDGTPYFTLTQYETKHLGADGNNRAESLRISLYFTLEWAEALARQFAEETLGPLPE